MPIARLLSFVLMVSIPASGAATGQEAAAPLSLAHAVAEALANNPELEVRRALVDVARERPDQERFLDPPMLGGQIWQWPVNTIDPRNTNMYMLMVGQAFPGRGKRDLRAAAARTEIDLLDAERSEEALRVVEQVTLAYVELAWARAARDVYLANLALLGQLTDSAQARYTVGRAPQHDLLQPVIEISRVHDRLIEQEEEAALAEARLNRWLGRPPHSLVGPIEDLNERRLAIPVNELQRLALERQPAFRTASAAIVQAEAIVAVAESEYRPDYSVEAVYSVMPGESDNWMARVGISWPRAPWARKRTDARVAEARAAVAAARARYAALENEIREAVHAAYVRVKTAERRAALLRTSVVPQIEQTFEVIRTAYQTDRGDLLPAIDVQRALLETRLDYARALTDLAAGLAGLSRAAGIDLDPHLVPTERSPATTRTHDPVDFTKARQP